MRHEHRQRMNPNAFLDALMSGSGLDEPADKPTLQCNGHCDDAFADVECPVHGINKYLRPEE